MCFLASGSVLWNSCYRVYSFFGSQPVIGTQLTTNSGKIVRKNYPLLKIWWTYIFYGYIENAKKLIISFKLTKKKFVNTILFFSFKLLQVIEMIVSYKINYFISFSFQYSAYWAGPEQLYRKSRRSDFTCVYCKVHPNWNLNCKFFTVAPDVLSSHCCWQNRRAYFIIGVHVCFPVNRYGRTKEENF